MSDEERAKDLFFQAADLFDAGDYTGAERLLRQVLALVPERCSVLANLAAALFQQDEAADAAATAERALALDRNNAPALLTLASAHLALKQLDQALAAFDRLVALTPDDAEAWAGRAKVLFDMSRWNDAVTCYDRVLALKPGYRHIKGQRVFARLQVADWDGIEDEAAEVVAEVRLSLLACPPFPILAITDKAAVQQACIGAFMADAFPPSPPKWTGERYAHERIRIAYMSPDFRDHAMAFLAAGLFESHDRRRFETIALSLGEDDGSALRRSRLPNAFEHFIIRGRSDAEIAALIRDMEVDICIDLAGCTTDNRVGVFTSRPAPVQVGYLGFPATMGTSSYDYIVGDRVVIPETARSAYAENVVWLPDTYQVNDDRRPMPAVPPSRAQAGLPEAGFVFCCFNTGYKIGPAVFDTWMRLLQAVPGSALWLVAREETANDRLRDEALRRGIDPQRLIFARPLSYDRHLTRFQLADLFLDTVPYNGGATVSDALWCGVPVVSCTGEAFASRMAASLLNAVGMPELVADNLDAYESLALALATDLARLNILRQRLVAGRRSLPLFDTARFTRNLETAYMLMWRRVQDGLPPAPFSVEGRG